MGRLPGMKMRVFDFILVFGWGIFVLVLLPLGEVGNNQICHCIYTLHTLYYS